MSKSRFDLVGRVHRGRFNRHVAMIEHSAMWEAIRRAKIAFWAIGAVAGLSTGVIASGITTAGRAGLIGLLTGGAVGAIVGLALLCWPALRVMWHWAAETITLTALLSAYLLLVRDLPWWLALTVLALVTAGPLALPSIRHAVVAWAWCVISRHRLRVCFAAFIASQRSGSAPLILLARPIPAGERIWVWLRPGLALGDLEARTDRLAAGCWAAECRISPASRRYSALLRIDIARRNPLGQPVASPLTHRIPTTRMPGGAVTEAVVIPPGLDLPEIPDTPAIEPAETKRRPRAIAATSTPPTPHPVDTSAVALPDDDLDDWI